MRLEKASYKAIKYACMNFHYAKAIPVNTIGFSVFNEKKEWCGVILYGSGANNNMPKPYGLVSGQVCELVRMALNGKQESTSKAMSISLKLLPKFLPLCKIVVSYADIDENHYGTIYQATNWYYTGETNIGMRTGFIINGKKTHNKSVHGKGVIQSLDEVRKHLDKNAEPYITKGKRKYIFPLDKSLIFLCKSLSKPYPKKITHAAIAQGSVPGFQSGDGVRSDLAAQLKTAIKQP
jgi:hypothetical protein